jgi:hypothetical protein
MRALRLERVVGVYAWWSCAKRNRSRKALNPAKRRVNEAHVERPSHREKAFPIDAF